MKGQKEVTLPFAWLRLTGGKEACFLTFKVQALSESAGNIQRALIVALKFEKTQGMVSYILLLEETM